MDNSENFYPAGYTYAEKLCLSDLLREPLFRSLINSLKLPEGSRGLDIGCGTGSNTLILADAVGSSGHVTGMDLSDELLMYAKQRADNAGFSQRISFLKCDMNRPAFINNTFDWVWSADCAGYAPGDAPNLIKNLAGLVKPGGSVFVLAWSSQQLLPGYPRLEARLNTTSAGTAPFVMGQQPQSHILRALGGFRAAGLEDIEASTFVGDIQAPLGKEKRRALASFFEMRWGKPDTELTEKESMEYQRLCSPGSPDFIAAIPDYYGFFTYTLFRGRTASQSTEQK
ncbi:MAG: class I SAM-dependent methyltransferase [Desulfococcaceae bacterium]